MRYLCFFMLLNLWVCQSFAQVNYTANDQLTPYDGHYRAGVNPGFHGFNWSDLNLADLMAGNPASQTAGIGATSLRGALPEQFAIVFDYSTWTPIYDYYASLGMKENTLWLGPADVSHADPVQYCPGIPTDMFDNLYEPIWDNGANGTPVNENNYYALYLYNVINAVGHEVRFWEVWNEPGFDYSGNGFKPPGEPGNWWENNPQPCDYKLRAPIFHYVRMLRITYDVVKTIAPEDYVVFSGVGYESFLDAVLRNTDNPIDGSPTPDYPLGGGAYFDVLGFHAYPHIDGSVRYWDNNLQQLVYTRHSDGAVDGLISKQQTRQGILEQYGYDGVQYPRKLWTVTEVNAPRRVFNANAFGSDVVQVNYVSKLIVKAIQNNFVQTHIWDLGEELDINDAADEFHLMGLYQRLDESEPFNQVVNDEGIAYKTASDFLFGLSFDEVQTNNMNLPPTVDGGAFRKDNGDYVYVLWAKTLTDLSEGANAVYSFPASFGIINLGKREWNYSQTGSEQNISAQNISLSGTPVFLSPDINAATGVLTLDCPAYEIKAGVAQSDGGAIVSWTEPTGTTSCPSGGLSITQTFGPANGSFFPFGPSVVQYTATDACGNEVVCVINIEVGSTDGDLSDCNPYRSDFYFRGEYNGHKYFLSRFDTTRTAAQEICEAHGGYLASINDQQENAFLAFYIFERAYIGLSDAQNEGQFVWEDGTSANFTNFEVCGFCPVNEEYLDYAEFRNWSGLWHYSTGNDELVFVMELPCDAAPPCTDADNDGLCEADDCDDNDPDLPATPGTACDDGDPNTENDVIQADGCTCEGTIIVPCTDADNDGLCEADDCDDNDPDLPATPGTACDDGDPNTENDVIQADGCTCEGTIIVPCTDADNDGLCEADDCDDNDPDLPATPGTVCDDGDPNTENDVIQADGCTCEGTIIVPCTDADNDGLCEADDCDDNDPDLPATPGTVCDDGDPNTENDVIQADGCTCAGTIIDPCNVSYQTQNNSIAIQGAVAAHVKIRVLDINWLEIASCFDNCNDPQIFDSLQAGDYIIDIILMDNNWQPICTITESFTIIGAPCPDNDGDGVCANSDCDDNNPNLPASPGTACDDGDPDTDNDVIQSDGCTCQGQVVVSGDCSTITISSGSGSIMVTVVNSPISQVQVFDPSWVPIFDCNGTCNSSTSIDGLIDGTYFVKVKLFTAGWQFICEVSEFVVLSGSGSPCTTDIDNDGVCAGIDCDDNNPEIPAPVGTPCDDGNPGTNDDSIQYDGCTCQGTPSTPSCAIIPMESPGTLSLGYPNSAHVKIRLFDSNWQIIYECFDNCGNPELITNLAPGTYTYDILLLDTNWGLVCSVQEVVFIPSNVSNPDPNSRIKLNSASVELFPNPSTGVIFIQSDKGKGQGAQFQVYNALGQMVHLQQEERFYRNPIRLDLSDQQSGCYFVMVILEDGRRFSKRFIIARDN